ncbi:acetyltransferase [Nannizzia gypsea CBS 118893]|uniref:Acetyltransferase n=1 Tax=Arthroderma gypseum (strain ATCC MYA-4604 / CBS 118893) TaxID=535722 RepID=E4V4L7_ARTGP|nr:acetyltransferase [Nannizzia gypsea CBS 118893]EFR04941.1 acetyltransferase [Nannizzia gypsea CBS 118893]
MAASIHAHPDPTRTLVPHLQRHLPHSGPLLRVIQSFGILPRSAEACVLASFSPESGSNAAKDGSRLKEPWVVAYVDVFRYPETQMWAYSSLEADGRNKMVGDTIETILTADEETRKAAREQLRGLLAYVRSKLLPSLLSTPGALEKNIVHQPNGVKKLPAPPPTGLLMGTINDGLAELLGQLGPRDLDGSSQKPFFHVFRVDKCMKYLFDRTHYDHGKNEPPLGYRFHDSKGRHGIQDHQFGLVLSRTQIQRTRASFPVSVALYHDDMKAGAAVESPSETPAAHINGNGLDMAEEMPIGWAFLAFDGSMIVLHVEPEHRGRGLAALISKEIMRRGMGNDAIHELQLDNDVDGKEKGWVFADVEKVNKASQRVMQKLGGEVGWAMRWIVAEVCVEGECCICAKGLA